MERVLQRRECQHANKDGNINAIIDPAPETRFKGLSASFKTTQNSSKHSTGYLRTGKVRRTEMRCIQKLEIWSSAKWPIWLRLNRDEVHVRKAKAHD